MNCYESNELLSEYLLLHYGSEEQVLAGMPGPPGALGFSQRAVTELLEVSLLEGKITTFSRALDVGCAVGGSSFELSKYCDCVMGIDYSRAFINAAQRVKSHGYHAVQIHLEGDWVSEDIVALPADAVPARVAFAIGNAMELPDELCDFDVVLAANLICRLPDPKIFLDRAARLVRSGGQLLLTSPFTWLESFTPKEAWLGRQKTGARSLEAIEQMLAPHFVLEAVKNLPFLIREHARKFQYGVACGMRWRRR